MVVLNPAHALNYQQSAEFLQKIMKKTQDSLLECNEFFYICTRFCSLEVG